MSIVRRKFYLSHEMCPKNPADPSVLETTFTLPPGEYYIGGPTLVIEEYVNEMWECDFDFRNGLYSTKGKKPLYYAPCSLDVDGAYTGSDGFIYPGMAGIFSASLVRKDKEKWQIDSDGKFKTFETPVHVKLFCHGSNVDLNGIEITDDNGFHLKIDNASEQQDEMDTFKAIAEENKFITHWECAMFNDELIDMLKKHPFKAKKMMLGTIPGKLVGDTWLDVWKSINTCVEKQAPMDHIFIEGFEEKGNTLHVSMGS